MKKYSEHLIMIIKYINKLTVIRYKMINEIQTKTEREMLKERQQLKKKERQWKKEQVVLQQRIYFLQSQLKDYQRKDEQNKLINESILNTFQQSSHEDKNTNHLKIIFKKHSEQIKKMKSKYEKQIINLQQKLKQSHEQVQVMKIEIQKIKLQDDQQIFNFKRKYQQKLENAIRMKQIQNHLQIQQMEVKLKKNNDLIQSYKGLAKENKENSQANQFKQPTYSHSNLSIANASIKHNSQYPLLMKREINIQKNKEKQKQINNDYLKNKKSVKILSRRIEQAMSQLSQNGNYNLKEKLNKIG